ncbi:hypothetical protein [Catellatospora citrea]|uniref:Uncharacterized protein n=1 Tax=Catellatospora citrea TaxID=53366 RepID=A0A8J3NZS8_9ACTN|nr:hypothetical protein [Catellatospora citrea]RKE06657.1 hypothetical protein C8E86_1479 [Catellatospora citrea]GIF98653.1 hypothetical protein Cci01nite_37470 [Catellatospora citrea]
MRPRPYVRCRGCDLVGPAERLDYELSDTGDVDWAQPVAWECAECGYLDSITVDQVLDLDAAHTCVECAAQTPCPATAARVECERCGLIGLGPATADPEIAGQLRAIEALHDIELRVQRALRDGHGPSAGPRPA